MNAPAGTNRQPAHWGRQFSLRALLAATIACSVPLAWLGFELQQARRQRAVVQEIERVGAFVFREADSTGTGGRNWLQSFLGDDFRSRVKEVYFDELTPKTSQDALKPLSRLRYLESLSFADHRMTDVGMSYIGELTELRHLDIQMNQVTDKGLEHLMSLTKLRDLVPVPQSNH